MLLTGEVIPRLQLNGHFRTTRQLFCSSGMRNLSKTLTPSSYSLGLRGMRQPGEPCMGSLAPVRQNSPQFRGIFDYGLLTSVLKFFVRINLFMPSDVV
jgi:hypothetical protein